MKLKLKNVTLTPELKAERKQDPISIIVEVIGIIYIAIGVAIMVPMIQEYLFFGGICILCGIFIFAFGHVINLIYTICKQEYIIKESNIEVINEKGISVKAEVINTVKAKVIENE